MTNKALTPKQRLFVVEYLRDLNATQAAIRAGYSQKTAREIGHQNLTKLHIQSAIQEAFEERIERTKITADRVLLEYARLGFSRMDEFMAWGPDGVKWKPSEDLSEDAMACISEITETVREMDEGGTSSTRRFKLHSKTAALRDMAQHLQLLSKDGSGGTGINVNVSVDARRQEKKEEQFDRLFAELDRYRDRVRPDVSDGRSDQGEPVDSPLPDP